MSYYIGATGEYIWEELLENTTSNVVISNNINFDATPLTDAIQQTITDNLGTALGELIQTPTQVASSTGVGVISLTALGLLSYYKLNRTSVQDVDSMVYSADYSSILTPGMFDDRVRIRYDNNWFSNAFYYVGGIKKGEILTYRPEQGSNILNLDATNIKLGTINNARLPQNYGLKLGIGTTPVATTDLHVYDATSANLLLETGGAGTASIDFQRGTINDVNVDFRIINDAGRFKLLSQDEVNLYTATTSEIVRFTRTLMTNFKDLYNVGNVGIGTSPLVSSTAQLHIYNSTSSVIRLETTTTGTASIEFQRGTINDANIDYRIINESDLFKIQSQNATNLYTAGTMELMRISPTLTTNYKDFLNNGAFNNLGNVNISTTAGTSSYKLNVEGDVNITGIGKKYFINNSPMVSSQWTTAGTTIEYNGGSVGIGTLASYKLNVGGTINADGLITAQAGITIATGQTLTLSGTAGMTAGGLITANGGITTSATGLITANNGITIATGKTLTLSGTAGITSGGLITAQAGLTISTGQTLTLSGTTGMTAGGLISANGGIQASTIKTNGGGLLKMATSTADFTQIGTTDSLLSVATCINLCGITHPTRPSCILYTTEQTGKHIFFTTSAGFTNEKMIIENNGNVGIGTTNPTALLDLVRTGTYQVPTDLLNMRYDDNWGLKVQQNYTAAGNIQYDFIHRYNAVNYNNLTFKGANVGIGTTDPAGYKLNVNGNTFNNGTLGFNGSYNGGGANYPCNKINLWNASASTQYGMGISGGTLDYFTSSTHNFYTGTDGATFGTSRFTISPSAISTIPRLSAIGGIYVYSSFDTASQDVYANIRVMNNTGDKNMYIGYGSGANAAVHIYSGTNNYDSLTCDNGNIYATNGSIRTNFYAIPNTNNDYLCTEYNASATYTTGTSWIRVAYGTFTGFHRVYTNDELFNEEDPDIFKNDYMGRVVISTGRIKTDFSRKVEECEEGDDCEECKEGDMNCQKIDKHIIPEWYSGIDKDGISIEDALPIIQLSRIRKDKRVFGVMGDPKRNNSNKCRLIVNSVGEGAICVSNTNGNIENGDYIQSSDLLGYGEKQDNDLLHNYTIAKATIDCNFELDSPYYQCHEIENGVRVAFIACSYHCG